VHGYFEEVRAACDRTAAIGPITEAFRWSNYLYWSWCIDVGDVVPAQDYDGIPRWKMPDENQAIRDVLIDGKDLSALNMARLPADAAACEAERAAVTSEILRFIAFFMTGDASNGSQIQSLSAKPGGIVSINLRGKSLQRHSTLVRRLAVMFDRLGPADARVEVAEQR